MTEWSEAWLRDYRARIHAPTPQHPTEIAFVLSKPTPLLNQLLRMHWTKKRKLQQSLSAEIARLVPAFPGRKPFDKATLTVRRYSVQECDRDGLYGGVKILADCLLVRSERHPDGLGFLVDDSPAHLTWDIESVLCGKRADQRTVVSLAEF